VIISAWLRLTSTNQAKKFAISARAPSPLALSVVKAAPALQKFVNHALLWLVRDGAHLIVGASQIISNPNPLTLFS
jgi:hypothetical protein